MKHRILIEFESSKLPADFTDIVLNRIYMLDCVDKKECTATLMDTQDQRRYVFEKFCPHCGDEQPEVGICQCWNDE